MGGTFLNGAIKNDWEFELQGDWQFFRYISERHEHSCDFYIYNITDIVNDTISHDYCFQTWFCNGVDVPELALSIGSEIVSLLNGIYAVLNGEYVKMRLVSLWNNNSRLNCSEGEPVRLRAENLGVSEAERQASKEWMGQDWVLNMLHLSTVRDDVYHLVCSFSQKPDFRTLSTILEVVEKFSASENLDLNIDNSEKRRFKHTANNFQVLGMDARHGDQGHAPPNDPMTHEQALDFIREVCKTYLDHVLAKF